MRISYFVISLVGATVLGCGGSGEPTVPVPKKEEQPPNFASVAGAWTGKVNYSRCEESAGFGVCASLQTPKSVAFQATIAQSSETHSDRGLIVANVTGKISFDGLSGNLSGEIDDIGSIFLDNDTFTAQMPPDHTVHLRDWQAQLYNGAFFSNFRMFIDSNNGVPGQAIVTANITDVVRVDR